MRKVFSSLVVACLVMIGSKSEAAVVFSTDFEAPTYSAAPLIGQDGWLITGTSVVSPIAVVSGAVPLTTTGQDVNRPFTAIPSVGGDSVTLQASINVSAAQATGDYFLHLGDGGTANFFARLYARSSVGGFQLAMGTSSGATGLVYGADLNLNQTYTILAQYNFVTGTLNDTGSLLVDGNSYVSALTTGTDAATISSVNLRQGTAGNAATVVVDNIVVTAVPEPSSLALLGVCGVAGVIYRRRRSTVKA